MSGANGTNPDVPSKQSAFLHLGPAKVVDPNFVPKISEPFPTPELMVDGLAAIAVANGALRLTLYSERQPVGENAPEIERIVVGRLVLTPQSAEIVAATLRAVLDDLAPTGAIAATSPARAVT